MKERKPIRQIELSFILALLCVAQPGCRAPMGADQVGPARAYEQIHDNPIRQGEPSRATRSVLYRFQAQKQFDKSPDETLRLIQEKALQTGDRDFLFVLSELNYFVGERLRRSVKPWEPRDARDYYLASAIYAWLFLFGEKVDSPLDPFDERVHSASDFYNHGLGWALADRRGTNALAILKGGSRKLPGAQIDLEFDQTRFAWPVSNFDRFVVADQFLVRGLSVRNRQPGLGAALVAVTKEEKFGELARAIPATVFLRPQGGLAELAAGRMAGSLELYSAFEQAVIQVGDRPVPLATDTTIATAYALNQSFVWEIGMAQFLSAEEKIPSRVYLRQPYRADRIPVVFVHGTFSSPIWWAEMVNTLEGDPILRQRYQFWYFIYNSGNPTAYSAIRLRDSLDAKVQELDPGGDDHALRQMVIVGHSQGGLLTKLTATDTGDKLLEIVLKTNSFSDLKISADQETLVRKYLCYQALPFVKRVIFISTPHRGAYLAGNFVRRLGRKLVTLPSSLLQRASELAGLREKLNLPHELRGIPTSLDSMSPRNPFMRELADIPLAPGVKGHSIIAVQGKGDYHLGKDGLVTYDSAHLEGMESEFIVRGHHSCQDKPPTIEEVRRILHDHLAGLPALAKSQLGGRP